MTTVVHVRGHSLMYAKTKQQQQQQRKNVYAAIIADNVRMAYNWPGPSYGHIRNSSRPEHRHRIGTMANHRYGRDYPMPIQKDTNLSLILLKLSILRCVCAKCLLKSPHWNNEYKR